MTFLNTSKFSKSIVSLTILLSVSTFVSAEANIELRPVNNNLETKACYVAATEGLDAAESFLQANDYSFATINNAVTCNGISIARFADKYAVKTNANEAAVEKQLSTFKLVALDNDASQLCVDAVVIGERAAREKHGITNEAVFCNSKTLRNFARSFKNKNVQL